MHHCTARAGRSSHACPNTALLKNQSEMDFPAGGPNTLKCSLACTCTLHPSMRILVLGFFGADLFTHDCNERPSGVHCKRV